MKKIFKIIVILTMLFTLLGCGEKDPSLCAYKKCTNKSAYGSIYCDEHKAFSDLYNTNIETETTTEITTIPVVIYSDILNGSYNNNYIQIEAVIDTVEKDSILSSINSSVWIKNGDTYVKKDLFITSDKLGEDNFNYIYNNLKSGDTCMLTCEVYSDSSFGISDNSKIDIIGNTTSLENIKQIYINHCQTINPEDLARNPEQYMRKTNVKLSGKVFQIVDESGSSVQFLLDTGGNNGIVNVYYSRPENSPRILENDNVTICGTFTHMYDYTSVLGSSKNVPSITCDVIL